jgi:hypothetical protein
MAGQSPDLSAAAWRKSTHSNNGGACVEAATNLPAIVAVRDSKDRHGPALTFTRAQWASFITTLKTGRIDLA